MLRLLRGAQRLCRAKPGTWGGGGGTRTHAHVNTDADAHAARTRLLPSAAQPPTSRTTRRPMGPTTDATPGPQAGAMLGSYLQPPASALEGDVPPPPVPHKEASSRAERQTGQRLQRQGRHRERGDGQSGRLHGGGSGGGGITEGRRRGNGAGGRGCRTTGGWGNDGAEGSAEPLLKACVSPHIPVLKPTLPVTALRGRAVGRGFGHKGGALRNGRSAYERSHRAPHSLCRPNKARGGPAPTG